MGLGWQVLAAARAYQAGGDVADMLAAAERVRNGVRLYITLDTIEYLYRGGRIGNARRLVGTMLNIKPLIYVDLDQGVVDSVGMTMTRRKGIDMLYNTFFANLDISRPLRICVLHGDVPQAAEELLERVRQDYHPVELLTNITCPAIGINTGPRAIALCGYAE